MKNHSDDDFEETVEIKAQKVLVGILCFSTILLLVGCGNTNKSTNEVTPSKTADSNTSGNIQGNIANKVVNTNGNTSGNINCLGIAAQQGDWIYYTHIDGINKGSLNKVRINGTSTTKINDDLALSINVVGDWIYYFKGSGNGFIYKIRTDSTENQKVE